MGLTGQCVCTQGPVPHWGLRLRGSQQFEIRGCDGDRGVCLLRVMQLVGKYGWEGTPAGTCVEPADLHIPPAHLFSLSMPINGH